MPTSKRKKTDTAQWLLQNDAGDGMTSTDAAQGQTSSGWPDRDEAVFRVLFVCTANLCRSPMAELLLRQELLDRWGPYRARRWAVRSAGVQARVGFPIHPLARQTMVERGHLSAAVQRFTDQRGRWLDEFRSGGISVDLLTGADLILTAAREHRSALVSVAPAALKKSFTIAQMATLLTVAGPLYPKDPALAGPALIDAARHARGIVPTGGPDDDLDDPVNQPIDAFRTCARTLSNSIESILGPLTIH